MSLTSEIFGEIRTCQVNNQIMFVGKDVAQALGYAKPQNALAAHVDREDKSTAPIQGTAYETRVTLINESGLYSLILSSKLPQAKAFMMEAIRKMEPAWVKIAGLKFELGSYKDANGQLRPCYQLTKTGVHTAISAQ